MNPRAALVVDGGTPLHGEVHVHAGFACLRGELVGAKDGQRVGAEKIGIPDADQTQQDRQIVGERRRLAARYQSLLSSLPIILPLEPAAVLSSYHLYIIRLNIAEIRSSHKAVFEQLLAAGIGVNLHYMPVYKQPYYQALGFERNYCPVAEHYYQTAISLPLFPGLSTEEQDYVVSTLTTILKE